MSNVQNLKPFQKGVSGNPVGRPAKIPAIDNLLADVLSEETNGVSAAREILSAIVAKAKAGNLQAAEMLLNRAYGKPKQAPVQDDSELTIHIVREPDNLTTDELRAELTRVRDLIQQGKIDSAEVQQSMVFGGKTIYF